jgi:TrkA-N domain
MATLWGRVSAWLGRDWWRAASAVQRRVGPTFTRLHRYAWAIIAALAALAIGLGTWGVLQGPLADGSRPSFWDGLYATLQLFVLESGSIASPVDWRVNIARFLAPLVAGGTAVRALTMLFYDRMQLGLLRAFGHDHVIVCGIGRKGTTLVADLRQRDDWVVVVENDPDNPALDRCRELGATVVIGSATDARTLERAQVTRAKAIVSVIGSDAANVETAALARDLNAGRTYGRLRCVIHVLDRGLRRMLMQSEIANREDDPFELAFFNVFESCARAMLEESGWKRAIARPEAAPHVVLIGLGQLGETIAAQAARDWAAMPSSQPLVLTIVDRHAEEERRALLRQQYPDLEPTSSIRYHRVDVRHPHFTEGGFLREVDDTPPVTAAFVCLGEDALGVYAGLVLARLLHPRPVPILVRTLERAGLAAALRLPSTHRGSIDCVRAVGLVELTCTAEFLNQIEPAAGREEREDARQAVRDDRPASEE